MYKKKYGNFTSKCVYLTVPFFELQNLRHIRSSIITSNIQDSNPDAATAITKGTKRYYKLHLRFNE